MMIVVNESAAASYLYLMGLTIDEELPLTQHLSLSFYKVVHSKKIESDQRFREAVDKTALSGRMGTV